MSLRTCLLLLFPISAACSAAGSDAPVAAPISAETSAPLTAEPPEATDAPVETDVSTPTAPTNEAAPAATSRAGQIFDVAVGDGSFVDAERDRLIPYRTYAPIEVTGLTPVVVVSHGGRGSDRFFRSGDHIGTAIAEAGMLAVHIGHLESTRPGTHRLDRPADVSALLDRIAGEGIELPLGFTGTPDLTRVGHVGHSFGAYTSHAVGGATFDRRFTDERVDAIVPISPQGADQFGAFLDADGTSTWSSVTLPAYNLVGGDEIDTNAVDTIDRPGWRLTPFENYPATGDTFLTVIDGQDHREMWQDGSDDVEAFIAGEIVDFLEVYVARVEVTACVLGDERPDGVVARTWHSLDVAAAEPRCVAVDGARPASVIDDRES